MNMKVRMEGIEKNIRSLWFDEKRNEICYIDQRKLPHELRIFKASSLEDNIFAINEMIVRGAPAIGISAAWALYQSALQRRDMVKSAGSLLRTRPTARDLFYAVEKIQRIGADIPKIKHFCSQLERDVIECCRAIGINGSSLIKNGMTILTHCNAGALATVEWGTALAPLRISHQKGIEFNVYVDETRPRLQGSKLTAWELAMEGIPHSIIVDNAAGLLMYMGSIDLVITGADRITKEGYVANKIGTYEKAVLAKENKIPFYVAAPFTTFDLSLSKGNEIPIEYRDGKEVTLLENILLCPQDSPAVNPAFDVTPPKYITGFITEKGIFKPEEISSFYGT